jgi:double-stranded uracil-DNA glycosylase
MEREAVVQARRPTKQDLEAARSRKLHDVLGPGLRVVFCGINPGLYSAAIGHHFGRPGNRFWPAMFKGGFTDRLYSPYEDESLLELGLGLTNLVPRTTASAAELSIEELREGGKRLRRKLRRYKPKWLAVLGISAYRTAFEQPDATLGPQPERINETRVWVLPSPSGLNAHYHLKELAAQFAALKSALDA